MKELENRSSVSLHWRKGTSEGYIEAISVGINRVREFGEEVSTLVLS